MKLRAYQFCQKYGIVDCQEFVFYSYLESRVSLIISDFEIRGLVQMDGLVWTAEFSFANKNSLSKAKKYLSKIQIMNDDDN